MDPNRSDPIYWPPAPMQSSRFVQNVLPYSVLFMLGILGNTGVLCYVFFITRSLKSSVTALGNTFIYIVALCAVDLLVTCSIPLSLSSTILNNWIFGDFGCKLHWVLELSNKMCSTFILTALAFDRYMAICHPENKRIHEMRQTILITTASAILSGCLICPVVLSARTITKPSTTMYLEDGISHPIARVICTDGMGKEIRLFILFILLIFAFLLPCTLLTYFYAKIVLRLRRQKRTMLQSRIPLRRITIYTMAATCFYLTCQVPFWLPQFYTVYFWIVGRRPPFFIRPDLLYYTHLLPFVSASSNWIFYARLNSQFKKGLILVTERMIRKRSRSMQQQRDTIYSEVNLEMTSRYEEVPLMCPNCEAQLSIRSNSNGKKC